MGGRGRLQPEHGLGMSQSMYVPLDLPLDFEAFYLGHQEAFHAYAEVHFGGRTAAEEVIHTRCSWRSTPAGRNC